MLRVSLSSNFTWLLRKNQSKSSRRVETGFIPGTTKISQTFHLHQFTPSSIPSQSLVSPSCVLRTSANTFRSGVNEKVQLPPSFGVNSAGLDCDSPRKSCCFCYYCPCLCGSRHSGRFWTDWSGCGGLDLSERERVSQASCHGHSINHRS